VTEIFNTATLRRCPECNQKLPSDWDWDVRSLAWMHDQPRRVSPSNNDLHIHDGSNGRNRFLKIEMKLDNRELADGQRREMEGLSRIEAFTCLLVRGRRVDRISVQRVSDGEWKQVVRTTCEALNMAIASWLRGNLWREASTALLEPSRRVGVPAKSPGHAHGWARVGNEFVCVQDFYAVGNEAESGCGEQWKQPA
jgi:hypothetical protein